MIDLGEFFVIRLRLWGAMGKSISVLSRDTSSCSLLGLGIEPATLGYEDNYPKITRITVLICDFYNVKNAYWGSQYSIHITNIMNIKKHILFVETEGGGPGASFCAWGYCVSSQETGCGTTKAKRLPGQSKGNVMSMLRWESMQGINSGFIWIWKLIKRE